MTDGSYLALLHLDFPAAQEIAYLSYNNQIPRIYLLDLETGNQKILGDFPGMTFSPRYSPDGKKIVMSLAKNGNTDIYEMNLKTLKIKRLTFMKGLIQHHHILQMEILLPLSQIGGSQKILCNEFKNKNKEN